MKQRPERKRALHTGKGRAHTWLGLPHYMIQSEEFWALDAYAVKALIDIAGEYNGKNNGDLSAAWSVMKLRGWRSKATLWKALRTLVEARFLKISRHGNQFHVCTLYAITWKPVDECPGKHIMLKPESVASNDWQNKKQSVRVENACVHVANA